MDQNADDAVLVRMTITTLDDGKVFFSNETDDTQPIPMVPGTGQIFPKVDALISTMKVGERKTVELSAADAFGERTNENMQQIPIEQIPEDLRAVGQSLIAEVAEGQEIPGTVREVNDQFAVVDFNHPLSGRELKVDFTVTDE